MLEEGRARRSRHRPHGFTLVELMITVTIVSILAAVSLPMLSTYVKRSRTTEATGFLAEIKARQESYRFDFGMYCNVSEDDPTALWPNADPGPTAQVWTANANWNLLGAAPPGGRSLFVYSTVAGPPGVLPSAVGFDSARGYNGLDFWFISTAVGDLDGDNINMTFESYSHSKGIWSSHGDNAE